MFLHIYLLFFCVEKPWFQLTVTFAMVKYIVSQNFVIVFIFIEFFCRNLHTYKIQI